MSKELNELKKLLLKNGTKNSCGGFNLLIFLIVTAFSIVSWLVIKIVKTIIRKTKEIEQASIVREEHECHIQELKAILEANCYTVSMSILKTTFQQNGAMQQNIDFYVYNKYSVELENINELINNVLYNELTISTKKNDLKGTIVIRDTELELIKDKIKKAVKKEVFFRHIEDIK